MKKTVAGLLLTAALVAGPGVAEASALDYVTVHKGDTLSKIAAEHHTTWQHLAQVNHLKDPNVIYPGERIALSGSVSKPPAKPPVTKHPKPPTSSAGQRVIKDGERYIGVPYVWGGNSPSEGFDCSGLTKRVFHDLGRSIPRTAEDQYRASHHVSTPQPGDLVFVHDGSGYVYHVAIYVNSHTWLEAERPGRGVNLYRPWSHNVSYGSFSL